MVTIDGETWLLLAEAAKLKGVSHQAIHRWVYRHKEVPTKRVGAAIVVRLQDLQGYQKREPRRHR